MGKSDLEQMVGTNETIVWRGKPKKSCFILESIFNSMLPIALIWGLFDVVVISMIIGDWGLDTGEIVGGSAGKAVIISGMCLHMMPVWIYLFGVLSSVLKHKHTEYIVTDKGVYISGGVFTFTYEMKPFTDLSHINIHRGVFDQMLGVGDVQLICEHTGANTGSSGHAHKGFDICDISDYQQVFQIVKQLQTDIYADTMYPNDLRPEENHGYQTSYKGLDR